MRALLGGTAAALIALVSLSMPSAASAQVEPVSMMLAGGPTSATYPSPVQLDADVYIPEVTPAPAVLLAHGFGGSKDGVAEEAPTVSCDSGDRTIAAAGGLDF